MQTRSSVSKTPQATPLRRSQRLLNQANSVKSQDLSAQNSEFKKTPSRSAEKTSKKPTQSSNGSTNSANLTSRLRRSPRLNSGSSSKTSEETKFVKKKKDVSTNSANLTSGLRRSPRLNSGSSSKTSEETKFVEKKKVESRENTGKNKRVLLDEEKKEVGRKEREICVGLKAVTLARGEVCERNDEVVVKRKIKRKREEGGDGNVNVNVHGWTREQELALQRAYYTAKPTPNFWKKVSKLVPGKSAQDCFDKIHSDRLTPIQPQPRSRAKTLNLSPIEPFSFSASKLLKPTALGTKRSSCSKQNSHVIQRKTVRHLLQKHCRADEGDEADLFSILEPSASPSMHCLPKIVLSTPKNLLEKQGFLQKCQERSSSGSKKLHTKLGNSGTGDLVSPPVLKQIKNRALHEKYIDQLHSREAKRRTESTRAEKKVPGKENIRTDQNHKIDEVRAAKSALFSDARYVIKRLQHLQCVDNSFDLDNDDDDVVGSGDDEGEL